MLVQIMMASAVVFCIDAPCEQESLHAAGLMTLRSVVQIDRPLPFSFRFS